jgi:hypothetical protein
MTRVWPGRRRLERKEGNPALVLTDDLNSPIFAPGDRAEGAGLALGERLRASHAVPAGEPAKSASEAR